MAILFQLWTRILKKNKKVFLFVCLILGATGAAVAAAFVTRPNLFLTSRSVGFAVKYLGSSFSPEWSSFAFSSSVLSFRRHRYVLEAANLCLDSGDGALQGCFSRLHLSAVVLYGRNGPRIESLDDFTAVSDALSVDLRRRPAGSAAKPPPAWLLSTPVTSLLIDVSSYTLTTSSASSSGSFRAVLAPEGRRPLSLTVNGRLNRRRLIASLTADTDFLKGAAPTFVDVLARADLGSRGRARAAFHLKREARQWSVTGGGEIIPPGGPLAAFRLKSCAGSANLTAGSPRPSAGNISCRYEMSAARRPVAPFETFMAASGIVSLSAARDAKTYEASLKAVQDPVTSWGTLSGDLTVRVSGPSGRPLTDASVSHELRAAAKVPRFEALVALVRGTKLAVPAPLNVLQGPLSLTLSSRGGTLAEKIVVGYVFESDLAGRRQRLVVRAKGDVTAVSLQTPGRSFTHAGELILTDVALEAPRLDVGRAPKVFADKRIKTGRESPAPPPGKPAEPWRPGFALPLRGTLAVKTGKPLIVYSNLAKDPIPAVLDLVLTFPPAAAAGKVSVRSFAVELFRRNAAVDHLDVELSAGSKAAALEGLVRYKAPTALISIHILGTTEKPRIEFTSAPPMKRADIIALLIFGKSPDELDPEQTASVSNTEKALESQAFGLASLYLFGATPIEHVGYDPATKTTMVRLRLPGGANLTLGGDFDQGRQLTVRKPLAPHWAIQSEITEQGQESRGAATFLEWFNRY